LLFPTTDFAVFFGLGFLISWLLNPFPVRWRLFMVAASYVFYAWWDWHFVFLLAGSTAINYLGGLGAYRARSPAARRAAMVTAVAAGLGLLGWFKYYGFFALNVANVLHHVGVGSPLPLLQVTLPVGISFFTFMGISYVVDIYRGQLTPAPLLDLAVYLSFFPHLVAGPIVRGSELLPQFREPKDPRRVDASRAAYLIFTGLFKKVVVSSYLASAIVDPVFAHPHRHSSLEILFAIYGYAIQIYADFSGYTDIAIGLALLLGYRFPANFDAPYSAVSLQDFWRRWHITLSRWLRDYLYIPLGGSRGSRRETCRNILLTMILGGLWHGAAWTFVAWGAIHGFGQVAGYLRRQHREDLGLPPPTVTAARQAGQRLATFHLVCLGWVFFRADSLHTAFVLLGRLVSAFGPAPLVHPGLVAVIALAIAAQYVPADAAARVQAAFSHLKPAAQGALLAGVLFLITSLGPQGVAPFIYYRF
jgi:D-alanyl-lipoteichoic acid acyltransferase DltB (MBOAT superfamily)